MKVEQLTSKTQQLEEELEKTKRQLKVVTAMAADEAEENRSAKEVIRSLTTQVHSSYFLCFLYRFFASTMLTTVLQLKEMSGRVSQKDDTSTNLRHTEKETTSESQTQTSSQTHIRSMVPHDSQSDNTLTSKSFVNGHRRQNEKGERVVQDEPGVYLTLLSLPGGGNELKRVRFRYINASYHFTCDSFIMLYM